tara:strand:- start:311 stop:487 length:177 start_codon:yes stop_codon:yes gene_type:complete
LDKTKNIPSKVQGNHRVRRMSKRLHEEFDKTWVKLEKGETTMEEWVKALNKWIQSELI